jgi:hypothetical protein
LYEGGINCPLFVSGNGVSRTGTVKFDKYGWFIYHYCTSTEVQELQQGNKY